MPLQYRLKKQVEKQNNHLYIFKKNLQCDYTFSEFVNTHVNDFHLDIKTRKNELYASYYETFPSSRLKLEYLQKLLSITSTQTISLSTNNFRYMRKDHINNNKSITTSAKDIYDASSSRYCIHVATFD